MSTYIGLFLYKGGGFSTVTSSAHSCHQVAPQTVCDSFVASAPS